MKISKKTNTVIAVAGVLTLVFSVLITTGVIKIGGDAINPYVAKNPISREDIVWSFVEKEESDGLNPPRSEVSLQIKDKKYSAGIYDGSCATQNTEMIINQISRTICWWAGGGTEIGVFVEDKKTVLKRRPVDEGSAEYPSFVAPFEVLLELE